MKLFYYDSYYMFNSKSIPHSYFQFITCYFNMQCLLVLFTNDT